MNDVVLLKNHLSGDAIKKIAWVFRQLDPAFQEHKFIAYANNGLDTLALKARVTHIIDALSTVLPSDFTKAYKQLDKVDQFWLREPKHDFAAWPIVDYVSVYGLKHPSLALPLLAKLTPLFSAEFAIRPFLEEHYKESYAFILQAAESTSHHVRRLASEGIRPRLPWGKQLNTFINDPQPIIAVLDKLKDDESDYVRRSVSNNLNDISKDNPKLVLKISKRWLKNASMYRRRLVRHALRTLLKRNNKEALALMGFSYNPAIKLTTLKIKQRHLAIGDTLEFEFHIKSETQSTQMLRVDYIVQYVRAGHGHSAKRFMLKELALGPEKQITVKKNQAMKQLSTRRLSPGRHYLIININGMDYAKTAFILEE